VRLAAVAALRALVDDFGFDVATFMGCAAGVMEALAAMLVDSDELDTQTQVWIIVGGWVGLRLGVCACMCVCARARVCVCVCV
jgi:hypothetical protein